MTVLTQRAGRRTAAISSWRAPDSPRDGRAGLAALAALAEAIAGAPDVRAVYRALFAFARATSSTHGIFVALYDPERRLRTCAYSARPDGEDDVSSLPPMPMSGSPQSVAIDTARPVLTADLGAALVGKPVLDLGLEVDPRLPQSSLAVPMVVLGRTVGAFEVQSLEPAAYGEDDLPAMVMAASIAALAIDRLRSFEPKGRALSSIRREIGRVIGERAFSSVFQPIVELESRAVVGYEALTRFADGTPPGVRFAQASAVGLGLELEAATLEAALVVSGSLPANRWLNLNVSPQLVLAREPLGTLLGRYGWQTVLELTEHLAVDDYDALRRAIDHLGPNVRLAIDDAGAGFASFRHILELDPHFVKLDRAIVRGIDGDLARQAFVAGMRHFSVTTGCGLIAEGIETEAELQALRTLGISLGQGYHLGEPRLARDTGVTSIRPPASDGLRRTSGGR